MGRSICKEERCTACEACVAVCPKNCISRKEDDDGSWILEKDETVCINCGLCERVCPGVDAPLNGSAIESYAAFRSDHEEHMKSASGGVASYLYEYALSKGMYIAGVELTENFEARFCLTNKKEKIDVFRNSKYTFSFVGTVYKEIITQLKNRKDVLFVGLPCQVAGIKKLAKAVSNGGNLITVDLVCHGTPPAKYLQEHIHSIETKINKKITTCHFRDAKFDTSNFAYTAYTHNSKEPVYLKYVDQDDNFQIGYHNALIYRKVCYSCQYAQRNRVGDITIGDYHGLGRLAPYNKERKNLSCVVVNTDRGKLFLEEASKEGKLVLHRRPVEEPMIGERQFNKPSDAPKERAVFIREYCAGAGFEKAANRAFKKYKVKNLIQRTLQIRKVKYAIMGMIPRDFKESIKAIIRKVRG